MSLEASLQMSSSLTAWRDVVYNGCAMQSTNQLVVPVNFVQTNSRHIPSEAFTQLPSAHSIVLSRPLVSVSNKLVNQGEGDARNVLKTINMDCEISEFVSIHRESNFSSQVNDMVRVDITNTSALVNGVSSIKIKESGSKSPEVLIQTDARSSIISISRKGNRKSRQRKYRRKDNVRCLLFWKNQSGKNPSDALINVMNNYLEQDINIEQVNQSMLDRRRLSSKPPAPFPSCGQFSTDHLIYSKFRALRYLCMSRLNLLKMLSEEMEYLRYHLDSKSSHHTSLRIQLKTSLESLYRKKRVLLKVT